MPARRKPTKLLEMAGAYEKNPKRKRAREPEAPKGNAQPLAGLGADGQVMWARLHQWLTSMGMASPVYSAVLQTLAEAYDDYTTLRRQVLAEGFAIEVTTKYGTRRLRNPKAVEMHVARDRVIKLLVECGLTPASKSKVQAEGGEADDIEEMFFKVTG